MTTKKGRPPKAKAMKLTPTIQEYVLTRMELGKTIIEICKEYNKIAEKSDSALLKPNTIHAWKRTNKEFARQYDIAYESRLQYLADYIEDLAKQPAPDTGDAKRDSIELQQRKLEIDTIKFTLAKLNASHYKQHVEVHNTGAPQIVVTSFLNEPLDSHNDLNDTKNH